MEEVFLTKKTTKEMGIPVKETVMASNDGLNAVLIQETLPPFSIYTKDGLRVDVPGIPVEELRKASTKSDYLFKKIEFAKIKREPLPKDANIGTDKNGKPIRRDYVKDVFEKHLRQQPNCPKDIDFALGALKKFYAEHTWLDYNNIHMSGMVRSAMKDGIHFDFYEKTPDDKTAQQFGTKSVNLEGSYAQYSSKRRAIEFNCGSYQNSGTEHNTLAHELCHYAMDDKESGAYLSTFVNSDFGKLWYNQTKNEVFFADASWKNFKEQFEKEEKKKAYGSTIFESNFEKHYKKTLTGKAYKTEQAKIGEMFARLIGLLAKKGGGLKFLPDQNLLKYGVQLVCDMATAKANGNMELYSNIIDVIKNHKINPETKEAVFNCMNIREEIKDRGNFNKEDWNNYTNMFIKLKGCIESEYKMIKEKIDAKRNEKSDRSQIEAEDREMLDENKLYNRFGEMALLNAKNGILENKKHIEDVKRERYEKKYGNEKIYGKDHLKPLEYPPIPVDVEKEKNLKQTLNSLKKLSEDDVLRKKVEDYLGQKK